MDQKTQVVICRKWNNPEITVNVNSESIKVSMGLDDFLMALGNEIGNPTLLVTTKMLKNKMVENSFTVLEAMKKETAKVV